VRIAPGVVLSLSQDLVLQPPGFEVEPIPGCGSGQMETACSGIASLSTVSPNGPHSNPSPGARLAGGGFRGYGTVPGSNPHSQPLSLCAGRGEPAGDPVAHIGRQHAEAAPAFPRNTPLALRKYSGRGAGDEGQAEGTSTLRHTSPSQPRTRRRLRGEGRAA
jgi:hypothetical protein